MAKVSVVVLNYNGESILGACLESIARQKYKPDEVLVVDNHSTDKSIDVIETYDEVTYHILHKNLGYVCGVNQCIRDARNDIVLHLSNDVVLDPGCLGFLVNHHDECDIIQPSIFKPDGSVDNYGMRFVWPCFGTAIKKEPNRMLTKVSFQAMSVFMTTKTYMEKSGYFDVDFSPAYYEDVDFYLRNKPRVLVHSLAAAVHGQNTTFKRYYEKKEMSELCRKHRWLATKKHLNRVIQSLCSSKTSESSKTASGSSLPS